MSNVDMFYNNGRCTLNNQKCEGEGGFKLADGLTGEGHDCRLCGLPVMITIKEKKL